jgi:hypothetical protein
MAAGIKEETVTGSSPSSTLLVSNGLEINCTSEHHEETRILWGLYTHKKLTKLGCTVIGNKFCTVYKSAADAAAKTNPGQILVEGSGVPILHGGAHYIKTESAKFSTIFMGGSLCTLPKENLLSGSTAYSLPKALEELVNQPIAPISAATEALLGVQLFYGKETATVDGTSGTLALSGPNKGKTWGAE